MCSAHTALMCSAWISEETAIIFLYRINLSVFITEAESVYCAVRSGSLNQTDRNFVLKGLNMFRSLTNKYLAIITIDLGQNVFTGSRDA
jgi:hypothetical protein